VIRAGGMASAVPFVCAESGGYLQEIAGCDTIPDACTKTPSFKDQ
jgi:hypothetical protein